MLNQFRVSFVHFNRNNTVERVTAIQGSAGERHNTGPTDNYGCTRWQPDLPPDEMKPHEKKQRHLEFFTREGLSAIERALVQQLMAATNCLQRKMINTVPAHSTEFSQWPFLFVPRIMCKHFETLTDINILLLC